MTCETCVYFDPVDGYCVYYAAYRRKDGTCDEHRKPRKRLMIMEGRDDANEQSDVSG